MCSSSEKVTLSDSEISDCLKKHGELIDVTEPCIFMPDTRVSGYEYRENEPNNFSLPFGINENDKKYLPDLEFILINDSSTNAIATSIKNIPIVGLYIGSITEVEYNVNLMIGSIFESNFLMERFKPKKIFIGNEGVLEIRSDDSLLGYKDERVLSYMITETALRFLVLHEIGHHVRGHIAKISNNYNKFALLKASDNTNSDYEIDADTFASEKLAQEFPLVLQGLVSCKEYLNEFTIEEIELMALNVLITAMTLPYSILYQPFRDKGTGIEGTITYREIFALMILTAELYNNDICKKAAVYDLCNKTIGELEEINKRTNNTIDIEKIRASQSIDFSNFGKYIMVMFTDSKRLYYHVNKIANIDVYLDDYMEALSLMFDKGKD